MVIEEKRSAEEDHSTLTRLASVNSAPSAGPVSGLLRLATPVLVFAALEVFSSRKKLGPVPAIGVAKFSGLGRVLSLLARKFQSL